MQAPRGRIVSVDVAKPKPSFVEVVPEQVETLRQVERVGGKFFVFLPEPFDVVFLQLLKVEQDVVGAFGGADQLVDLSDLKSKIAQLEVDLSGSRRRSSELILLLDERSAQIVCVVGEEAILSGEAHSRANINLPGKQEALIHELHKTGKPLVVVIMPSRAEFDAYDKTAADVAAWPWVRGNRCAAPAR